MQLPAHSDAFHEAPGAVVVEEAVGNHPVHAEVLEAGAQESAPGFGGVPPADVRRVEDPAELSLRVAAAVSDLALGPGVLAAEHEVADDSIRGLVAQGD